MEKAVWVLEQRKNQENHMESTFTSVFSSVENAFGWIKENQDYDDGEYWWAVFYSEVDTDLSDIDYPERNLFIFNQKGEEIFWQPDLDEHVVSYGDKVLFLNLDPQEEHFSNVEFEGTIVGVQDGVVCFEQVTKTVQDPKEASLSGSSTLYANIENLRYVTRPKA